MDSLRYIVTSIMNFPHTLLGIFNDMDSTRWLRLIAIVGGYLLIRPWLMKLSERYQRQQLEKAVATKAGSEAKISPNVLRGLVEPIEEEEAEEGATGVDLGKKAKKRQRMVEKMAAQQQQQEGLSEEQIRDLLVDYEEGEDGW